MALTKTQVSELYTAIFNRASEGDGNAYWAGLNASAATIAQGMLDTTDAATYFGTSLATNQAFVEHIYLNTLNKTVAQDATGIAYWVDLLDAGHTRGEVVSGLVSAVADYATSTDATTLAAYNQFTNRVAVSDYTADTLATAPSDYATSTSFSSGLTVTDAIGTVTTAKAVVNTTHDAAVVPTYTIASDVASVTEGSSVTFTVTASEAYNVTATTLNYQIAGVEVAGGTATPASDLGKVTGEVTIAAGAKTGTFTLTPTDDGVTEGYEGFKVSILDSSFATVATSANVVIKDGAEAGQTFALATTTDSITGTSGNDTINAAVGTNGLTTNGTTLNAGDIINGGAGTDTLNVSITGTHTANNTVSAVTMTGVEKISVSNFETTEAADGADADAILDFYDTINMSQATGVTTIALANSASTGDTYFTSVQGLVAAEMSNGAGDLSITYVDSVLAGATDAQTLTVSAVSAGTFTVAPTATGNVETLNVVSNGSVANVLTGVTVTGVSTVNVSGAQDVNLGTVATATTLNASTATGKVTAIMGSTNATLALTGGTADDRFDVSAGTMATTYTINGGTGTDTVVINDSVSQAVFTGMTNVEKIELDGATTLTLASAISATTFDFSDTGDQTLTLSTGFTGDTTVVLTGDATTNNDTITNTANVKLTVVADAQDIDATTTIRGGTGTTDTMVLKAGDGNTTAANAASTGTADFTDTQAIDVITVAKGYDVGDDITLTLGAYATALTIDASALTDAGTVNAAGTATDGLDSILTVSGSTATKALTVTGGAGWDQITTGSGNDVIDGGAGNDTITSGTGNDTLQGGAGDDTFVLAGNLTSADIIDGGEGTDILQVTSISATALAGVTNVESLAVTGASTVSLSSNLSFTTLDISDASTQSVTFGTGYTNATTVYLKTDSGDTVVNTAKVALTVDATLATAITGSTLTGGAATTTNGVTTGNTDALVITAGGSITADSIASSATATFGTTVTNFDSLTVRKGVDAGDDIVLALGAYATDMTIDASALTDAGTLTTAGTATNGDDSTLTVTSSGTGKLNITGGAGWDVLTLTGTADHTINAGAGNDTISLGAKLTNGDTIDGGAGTDTIIVDSTTAVTDVAFINVTNVENLQDDTATADITLSTYASAAGIVKVTVEAGNGNDVVNAAGMSTGIEIVGSVTTAGDDTLTGGTANDTFTFSGLVGLEDSDTIVGGTGTDTISLDNSAGAMTAGVDTTNGIVVSDTAAGATVSGVEKFVVKNANGGDTVGSENADAVTLNFKDTASAALYNTIVDGSVITDTNDIFTVDASAVTDANFYTTFNITGGAAADVLRGGDGADTISGGNGADTIDGGVGADTLTGGAGADRFEYTAGDSAGSKVDTITDFEAASDKLVISLTGDLIYDLTDKGDVTSISNGLSLLSATGTAGEYFYNSTDKQFVQDSNGDGLITSGDTIVTLTGASGFNAADAEFRIGTAVTGTKTITTGDSTLVMTAAASTTGTITTGAGNDVILGAAGVQTVIMGNGTNTATLGAAGDVVTGGTGVDTYIVAAAGESITGAGNFDTIKNFTNGTDKIIITGTESAASEFAAAITTTGTGLFHDANGSSIEIMLESDAIGTSIDSTLISASSYQFGMSGTVFQMAASSTVLGSANADFITAGATAASITGGAGVDTIVGNTGTDTVIINYSNVGTEADVVGTFTANTDLLKFSLSALETAGTSGIASTATNFVDLNDGTDATAALAVAFNDAAGGATAINASAELLIKFTGTFASTSDLETALEVGGTDALSGVHADVAAGDAFLIAYSDGSNAYIASAVTTAGDDGAGGFVSGDLTINNLVQLTGDVALASADYDDIAFIA